MNPEEQLALRIKTILPETYQDCYEEVQPVSMGSAALKYGADGKVAWNEIWATFCDLAMAGGPPHKGTLLEPGANEEIAAEPGRYRDVVAEICRGVALVTRLAVEPSASPGWVRVECADEKMAGWLVRAINMENVSARLDGKFLDLPAGPRYRVEKEIKNVITSIAKTCHYWVEHTWPAQERAIGALFLEMAPLIEPGGAFAGSEMAEAIRAATGLEPSLRQYPGWLGIECPNVRAAIWMMRALVASNILSRREGTTLFVPVNPVTDPHGAAVVRILTQIHAFAKAREIL